MHAADRFLKFAAEYQSMAKISPSRESKATWNGLAQRWAEFAEQFEAKGGAKICRAKSNCGLTRARRQKHQSPTATTRAKSAQGRDFASRLEGAIADRSKSLRLLSQRSGFPSPQNARRVNHA